MIRERQIVGAISVTRAEVGAFAAKEVDLLQTFADQAVIAIENVRLFNETKEALEQQTATAEILRVISGSLTDTQPVFDAIVESCQRLFAGKAVALTIPKDGMIESVAFASDDGSEREGGFLKPWPLDRDSGAGACLLDSRVIVVPDTMVAVKQFARMAQLAVALGYHSALVRAVAARRQGDRLPRHPARGHRRFRRQGNRAGADLRRSGGDRDRERAPVPRNRGGARAADRHLRRAARDQRVAHRRAAGVRHHRRAGGGIDGGALLPRHPARRRHAARRPARRERGRHHGAAGRLAAAIARQHLDRRARAAPARRRQRRRPARRVRRRLRAGHEAGLRAGRLSQRPERADAARPAADRRRDHRQPCRARPLRRQGNRAAADLRAPGRGGDPERAAVQRDQGSVGAAESHHRDSRRHQQVGGRHAAGVREDSGELQAPVRRRRARCAAGGRAGHASDRRLHRQSTRCGGGYIPGAVGGHAGRPRHPRAVCGKLFRLRPGGDRDPERAAVQGGAGGAPRPRPPTRPRARSSPR